MKYGTIINTKTKAELLDDLTLKQPVDKLRAELLANGYPAEEVEKAFNDREADRKRVESVPDSTIFVLGKPKAESEDRETISAWCTDHVKGKWGHLTVYWYWWFEDEVDAAAFEAEWTPPYKPDAAVMEVRTVLVMAALGLCERLAQGLEYEEALQYYKDVMAETAALKLPPCK
jgi:hypothetical protein